MWYSSRGGWWTVWVVGARTCSDVLNYLYIWTQNLPTWYRPWRLQTCIETTIFSRKFYFQVTYLCHWSTFVYLIICFDCLHRGVSRGNFVCYCVVLIQLFRILIEYVIQEVLVINDILKLWFLFISLVWKYSE